MSNLEVASQANGFSNRYLQTVGSTSNSSGDLLTCPIGLLMLMSTLLGSGAPGGSTARQISKALGFNHTTSDQHSFALSTAFYKSLSESLDNEKSRNEKGTIKNVKIANALMLRKECVPRKQFVDNLDKNFDASLFEVDFANPTAAVQEINAWADKESNGLIPRVFNSPSEIDADTRMMLSTLFVFKDNWMATFDRTEPGWFFTAPEAQIKINMMKMSEKMSVVQDKAAGYTAIKKPMLNSRFSFIVILPNKEFDISAVNRMLFQTESFRNVFRKSRIFEVKLTMPKFHLDVKQHLKNVAQRMGITDLFDEKRANLSGITEGERLFVETLRQASVLRVDEYGVEAAAVTSVSFGVVSLAKTITFTVDQPFGCIIYDELLDVPLFVARVFNPKQ